MAYERKRDRACPSCPDGHEHPRRAAWGTMVEEAHKDGDGRPTVISVARSAGGHVAPCDAEWVFDRLNGSAAVTPEEALEALGRLAEPGELGGELPGLAAVVEVIREQLKDAYRRKALKAARGSYRASGGRLSGGGVGAVIQSMDRGEARRAAMTEAEVAAARRAAMKRRGIGP